MAHPILTSILITAAISALHGAYRGLQNRFGRNVIRGYLEYRAEWRAWKWCQANDPDYLAAKNFGEQIVAWEAFRARWIQAREAGRARSDGGIPPDPDPQ